MIEQYLYSIPRSKKIFYGILLTWLFLALLSYRVNCGFFTWIAGEITDNITDEIFTSINQSLGEAIGALIDWFFNVILKPLGPQLKTFTDNTNFASVSLADFIDRFSIFTGMFLATLIFGFGICIYFLSGKITDSRDTPISLFARYCIAIAICYQHKPIYETIIKIIDDVFSSMTYSLSKSMMKEEGFLNIVAKTADDKLEIFGKEVVLDFVFPGVGLIVLIIQLILIWKLIKGFLKLYCEMVSRYIVTIVLLLLFAAFGGTIVSNNTSSIFKSYLRTMFCSFLVMIFNMVWFKGCFFAVLGGNKFTFIQYIFVLELLAFGLKFDGMLRSMGLGVATGGSRIGNAIGGAGRNIANAMRLANDARKAGGSLLQARGLASNNPDIFRLGTKMAAGPFDALNPGQGGIMQMAAMNGAKGRKLSDDLVTPKDAAQIMNFAAKNPGNRDAMNALNGLSDNSILAGAKYMAAQNGIKVNDASVCQFRGTDGKQHTGIRISGEKAQLDSNGMPVLDKNGKPKTHDVNGIISDARAFDSSQMIGDESMAMGLHCDNTLKNGETCNVSDAADVAGQSTADALGRAQENGLGLGDNAYLEKDGRDSNGQDAFNVYDNGKQVGTIAGGEFTAAADLNSVSGDGLRQAEAKEEILSQPGVADVGDMKATGYTATARNSNGEDVYLAATFSTNADGSSTATITNSATGESSSFNVPEGTSYSDALSSEDAKHAASSVSGGGEVSSFEPTSYSATAYDSDSAQSLTATVESNGDGSSTATITGENGRSASFTVPEGATFDDALTSEEGQNALSSVGTGGNITEFTPTGFSAEAVGEDGSVSSLSARFESNDDGSATGIVTNMDTGESAAFNVHEGATLDEAFASGEAQNAISSISGGAEVSDFTPSEYSAISLDENPSGATLSATFEANDDGSGTGTITNNSTGESASFDVSVGTTYEDALSSNEARAAIGNVTNSDIVTEFTPSEYGAFATADSGYAASTVSVAFSDNADGSSTATLTNSDTGESTSFDVPQGIAYDEALMSEEAQKAVSSITGGGTADAFIPSDYTVPVTGDDGSSSNYHVRFDGNSDGTYDAHISDANGNNVSAYSSKDDTYGNSIRDEILSNREKYGAFDSVSAFEEIEGKPGVYQATATKGEIQTIITATDKGIYAESSRNDDPRSAMFVSENYSGNRVAYDVNFGKSYDSTKKNYGSNRTYNPVFGEEQQQNDEARDRTFNNGNKSKPKVGRRNNGRKGGR
ncbi:hypothetical protein [Butyrivibrio sp. AC2005]|uniref:hypothetical protein n=1 Tax=Butyrivibrio sp. AC2005 TaxID=1280672 RepID=UPI000419AAF2|nr:hypothetical protein [Butyrivibrio sp. AC2005]